MRKPTVRLHFTDGTHYDTYHSMFLFVHSEDRPSYRKIPKYASVSRIQNGDTIDVPSEEEGGEVRRVKLARKEDI